MATFLETGRLTLRRFTEGDVDNLLGLDSDPEVTRYLTGGEPTPRERIRDEIIPGNLAAYERYPGFGTWAAGSGTDGDSSAGSISGRAPVGGRREALFFLTSA